MRMNLTHPLSNPRGGSEPRQVMLDLDLVELTAVGDEDPSWGAGLYCGESGAAVGGLLGECGESGAAGGGLPGDVQVTGVEAVGGDQRRDLRGREKLHLLLNSLLTGGRGFPACQWLC